MGLELRLGLGLEMRPGEEPWLEAGLWLGWSALKLVPGLELGLGIGWGRGWDEAGIEDGYGV